MDGTGWCDQTYPSRGPPNEAATTGPSPAFQYANPYPWLAWNKCHRLGAPNSDATTGPAGLPAVGTMLWGLYDSTNPSRGVTVQYLGGDACPSAFGKTSRQLKLWLLCYDDATNIPDDETILENQYCAYDIFLKSAFGCPVQCPLYAPPGSQTRRICAGHGVCDFDSVRGNSRCFCNAGWSGSDCSSAVAAGTQRLGLAGVILIVVSFILVLMLALLAYLWIFKISKLRLDPTAYSTLAGADAAADPPPGMGSASAADKGGLN